MKYQRCTLPLLGQASPEAREKLKSLLVYAKDAADGLRILLEREGLYDNEGCPAVAWTDTGVRFEPDGSMRLIDVKDQIPW